MKLLQFISGLLKNNTSTVDTLKHDEALKRQNEDIRFNDPGVFTYNDWGFSIDLKNEFHLINWTAIERLTAYKADIVITDEICIDITYDNKTIIITEETKGWFPFLEKLTSALPLANENWQALVLASPYEYDLTPIYEREDRRMPLKSNFHSIIYGKSEAIIYLFHKNGWTIRKSSMTGYEFRNSWSELVLERDNEGVLLHGLIAYHPGNVKIIRQLFLDVKLSCKFEFYDDNGQIIEQLI